MRLLVPLLALAVLLPAARAQPADTLSARATASLLTMRPGSEVYSVFGHSAFRIHDPATGLDRTYNFGTFDFDQPFFVARFVRGRLDYVLDTAPYEDERAKYAWLGRPMIEQRLALAPEEVRRLYGLLEENALPENRAYRYDFFFDNCSTRLLDVLDEAVAPTDSALADNTPTDSTPGAVALEENVPADTFRELLQPYLAGSPLLRLGINLGLGLPADRVATPRERTFLPEGLMAAFDDATVDDRPLVADTDIVVGVPGYEGPSDAFDWPAWLIVALTLGSVLATVWGRARRTTANRWGRAGDAVLFGIAGLAGLPLVFLWLGTEHTVTGPNLNLMWAWPTHLAAAWVLRRPTPPRWLRPYLWATAAVTVVATLAWFLLPQTLPLAALPTAALLALRAAARAYHD